MTGPDATSLTGRQVLVGVTGGIACYKTCTVVSSLVQKGAGVTCVMTRSATRFVRPLTFEALSGRKVLTALWKLQDTADPQHIRLAEAADVVVIAPATANVLAKLSHGLADDLLSTLMLVVEAPVIIAPAMNERMWNNRAVQANVARLRDAGYRMVGPGQGWMACRTVGVGRMAEPDEILAEIERTCAATA